MSLYCNRGHEHRDGAYCEQRDANGDDCKVCNEHTLEKDVECSVSAFVRSIAPDCSRTFYACDNAFLTGSTRTGFTRRATAALIHLREAWCNADETNAPAVAVAIAALFNTRSFGESPEDYLAYFVHNLDENRAKRWEATVLELADRLRADFMRTVEL